MVGGHGDARWQIRQIDSILPTTRKSRNSRRRVPRQRHSPKNAYMRWGNFCRCSMRDTCSCGRRLRIVCKQRYAQNQKLSQIGVDTRCMYDAEQSIPGFRVQCKNRDTRAYPYIGKSKPLLPFWYNLLKIDTWKKQKDFRTTLRGFFMSRRSNNQYSVELKLQAVQDYLRGGGI